MSIQDRVGPRTRRFPPSAYDAFVFVEGEVPLRDVFPDGISVMIDGDNIELLTPPDSRYKVIDGVVVRIDKAEAGASEPQDVGGPSDPAH